MLYPLPNGSSITHPALVAALVKPGAAILDTLTPEKADAWHMASCIPGEAGELFAALAPVLSKTPARPNPVDRDNLVEELGDLAFYVEGLCTPLGVDRDTVRFRAAHLKFGVLTLNDLICELPARAADVFDAVKKWVIYNKPLDISALIHALAWLDLVTDGIRQIYHITTDEMLGGNVMKLGTRYASISYSDQAAQDRADKQETLH